MIARQHTKSKGWTTTPQRWMLPAGVEEGYARFFASQLDDPDTVILVAKDALGEVAGYAYAALEPRSWADLREACIPLVAPPC